MIKDFLAYTSPLAFILPLIAATRLHKNSIITTAIQVLRIHVFVAVCVELSAYILWIYKKNNLFLLHVYTLWELEIISLYYIYVLKDTIKNWIIPIFMIFFAMLSIFDALKLNGLNRYNVYTRSIECIIIMLYTTYHLYQLLLTNETTLVHRNVYKSVSISFLIYFSLSFFIFMYSNNLMRTNFIRYLLWNIHITAAWILYTTIGIALWKAGRK